MQKNNLELQHREKLHNAHRVPSLDLPINTFVDYLYVKQ